MYAVVNTIKAESVDSEHENFQDALERAYELALVQAAEEGIDHDTIFTFEEGNLGPWPVNGNDGHDAWEAGAGPENDESDRWPRVIWKD